jgi:hypothetical protein
VESKAGLDVVGTKKCMPLPEIKTQVCKIIMEFNSGHLAKISKGKLISAFLKRVSYSQFSITIQMLSLL